MFPIFVQSFGGKSLAWSFAIEWAFCPKRTSNKTHHGWEAQMGQQLFQLHCSIEWYIYWSGWACLLSSSQLERKRPEFEGRKSCFIASDYWLLSRKRKGIRFSTLVIEFEFIAIAGCPLDCWRKFYKNRKPRSKSIWSAAAATSPILRTLPPQFVILSIF